MDFDEIMPLIRNVNNSTWGHFIGIHAHIGSQIFDDQPFYDLITILVNFIAKIKTTYGISVDELNCGGGFGIQYLDSDQAPDIQTVISKMANQLQLLCRSNNLTPPMLIFEPGRSIIATAGVTLYSVGSIKEIPKVKDYIFVDGGMADNPRPIMYQSEYTFEVLRPSTSNRKIYTIAGKFCESGDILAKDVSLPIVSSNDHIVVYGTGAYNYSMASNYNRFCRPAMVLVNDGSASLIVRRETYDDIIRFDEQ